MFVLLLFFLLFTSVNAQNYGHLKYDYDISIDYGYFINNQYSSINQIDKNQFCCEELQTGKSNANNISISLRYSPSFYFNLVFSTGYSAESVVFKEFENEDIVVNAKYYPGLFEHRLKIRNDNFFAGFGLEYNISEMWYIGTSFYFIYSDNKDYYYSENLILPSDRGVFKETGSRERNIMSGYYAKNLNYSLSVNTNYLFQLNKDYSLFISPELSLIYSFGNYFENDNFDAIGYKIGAGIHYKFGINEFFLD